MEIAFAAGRQIGEAAPRAADLPRKLRGGRVTSGQVFCGGGAVNSKGSEIMLREKIGESLKTAMRAKDAAALSTLRMIGAAIKQKDIDVARARGDQQISDEEILNLLQGLIKSRRESIEQFKTGGRQDLVDKETAEIDVIEQFLPKQMSDSEAKDVIKSVIASLGASSIKDMGKVMNELKTKYAGQLDMSRVSGTVKELLSGGK